jgi:GAF domain-containing protein
MHIVDVFYTPLEERFERITRLARRALNVPVAAITCIGGEKQWFKSVAGWAVTELPISHSLCPLTMEENRICVVNDTQADKRTKEHPLVVRKPNFRFYAGYPLQETTGLAVGTLCVFDTKPREFSEEQLCSLHDLGEIARQELLANQLSDAQARTISASPASSMSLRLIATSSLTRIPVEYRVSRMARSRAPSRSRSSGADSSFST